MQSESLEGGSTDPKAASNVAERVSQYLLWGMLLLFAGAALFIYSLKKDARTGSIKYQEVHDVVLEIHREKSDVAWYRGRMGNGDWITLNTPMVYSVAIGDSILKEKGQDYFTVKKKDNGKLSKWAF